MKKSEITFIRLMSLIGIMSLNLILLLVFSGEHVFQNILNRMNSNVYAGASLDTSIYNYYYYAGLGSIYNTSACSCGCGCIQEGEYGGQGFTGC